MIERMTCTAVAPGTVLEQEVPVISAEPRRAPLPRNVAPPGTGGAARLHLHDLLEKEARRIAQSLHDEAGQLLAVVCLKLDELRLRVPVSQQDRIADLESMLAQFEGEVRRLSHELRPMVLDDFGLVPAVEFLRQGVARRSGMAILLESSLRERFAPAIETALYRIIYEALRAAGQRRSRGVRISLRRAGAGVECMIRQEGARAAADAELIEGIRQRVEDLEGALRISEGPGSCDAITITVPLE